MDAFLHWAKVKRTLELHREAMCEHGPLLYCVLESLSRMSDPAEVRRLTLDALSLFPPPEFDSVEVPGDADAR
jgi:hypothetical protein